MKTLNIAFAFMLMVPTFALAQKVEEAKKKLVNTGKTVAITTGVLGSIAKVNDVIMDGIYLRRSQKMAKNGLNNFVGNEANYTLLHKRYHVGLFNSVKWKTEVSMNADEVKRFLSESKQGVSATEGFSKSYLVKVTKRDGKFFVKTAERSNIAGMALRRVAFVSTASTILAAAIPARRIDRSVARFNSSNRIHGKTIIQPWIDEESKEYKDRQASQQ